jgi:nitrilase
VSDASFRIAAVQATSVFLDREGSVETAIRLIHEAAASGAKLVVFPEAFIAGYPLWVWFVPPADTHLLRELYTLFHEASISIPGPETELLGEAARECGVAVAIGVNERNSEASDGTIYNTLLYLAPDGSIAGRHRKLVPTAGERLVWGRGDGSDLEVYDFGFARVGGLICWENYMPLARYALTAWGSQIHVAPTWDRGEPWLSSMNHIAKEGRCFVVGCSQVVHRDDIPDSLAFKDAYLGRVKEWVNPGLSVIVDPDGKPVAGPVAEEETILYADVDPAQLVGPRWQLDTAGHYARPDVFELRVHRTPRPMLTVVDEAESAESVED